MKRLSPAENGSAAIRKEMIDNIKILGESHPETMRSQQKLTVQLFKEGQWDECLKYSLLQMDRFEREIEMIISKSKDKSQKAMLVAKEYEEISTIITSIYERYSGQIDERIKTIERVLLIYAQVYGKCSQQYAQQLQRKARALFDKEEKVEAMACLEECIQTQRSLLSEFHIDFAETYRLIGAVLAEYGLFSEGITHCHAALAVVDKQIQQFLQQQQQQQQMYGQGVSTLSQQGYNQCLLMNMQIKVEIGVIMRHQNRLDDALSLLFDALKQQQQQQTANNSSQAQSLYFQQNQDTKHYLLCLHQLSLNLRDIGRLDEAFDYAQKCLNLLIDTKSDTLDAMENIGNIHYLRGDLVKAREVLSGVLSRSMKFHEAEPSNLKRLKKLLDILRRLITISQILSDNTTALYHLKTLNHILTKVAFNRKQNKHHRSGSMLSQPHTPSMFNSRGSSRVQIPSQESLRSKTFNTTSLHEIKMPSISIVKNTNITRNNTKSLLGSAATTATNLTGDNNSKLKQQRNLFLNSQFKTTSTGKSTSPLESSKAFGKDISHGKSTVKFSFNVVSPPSNRGSLTLQFP